MQTLQPQDLMFRSDSELNAILNRLNRELSEAEPFSPKWRAAYASIEAILRARHMRRAHNGVSLA